MAHIVFYGTFRFHVGGVERTVLQYIEALSSRYQFTVMGQASLDFQDELAQAGAQFYEISIPRAFSPLTIHRLARLLKNDLKADLIHTLDPRGSTVGCPAGWLAGIPVFHWHHVSPLNYSHNPFKRLIYAAGEAFLGWTCIDAQIFVSRTMYQHHIKWGITPAWKSHYIPIAVAVNICQAARQKREQQRLKWNISTEEFLWIHAGRYSPEKAQDVLLEAVAKLPDTLPWRFLLAGGGALEPQLQQQIQTLKLEKQVQLVGSLPHQETIELLAAADGLVLPSRYENMPGAVLEAMAMNIPCIVTDVGDSWHMTGGGDIPAAGLCVPVNDTAALAEAMERLMTDKTLYRQLAKAGLPRAARFDPPTVIQQMAALYDRFL